MIRKSAIELYENHINTKKSSVIGHGVTHL